MPRPLLMSLQVPSNPLTLCCFVLKTLNRRLLRWTVVQVCRPTLLIPYTICVPFKAAGVGEGIRPGDGHCPGGEPQGEQTHRQHDADADGENFIRPDICPQPQRWDQHHPTGPAENAVDDTGQKPGEDNAKLKMIFLVRKKAPPVEVFHRRC